ncbi:hypothetical protein T439DRAFT_322497 [Meredithblackwellia eburnea MCA 4105]
MSFSSPPSYTTYNKSKKSSSSSPAQITRPYSSPPSSSAVTPPTDNNSKQQQQPYTSNSQSQSQSQFQFVPPTTSTSPLPQGTTPPHSSSSSRTQTPTNTTYQPFSSQQQQQSHTQQQQQQHATTSRARMPYHSTFQPQGVRRDRTEQFAQHRRKGSEQKKLQEGRLCRRMEKLVALHFPPPIPPDSQIVQLKQSTLSQISDIGGSFRGKSPRDLWRSVATVGKSEAERSEQSIVKWQEDSEAKQCPICTASFGLKTRRHHCRLCGRVVCFLPPSSPADFLLAASAPPGHPPRPLRSQRCSTFFTYEYDDAHQVTITPGEKKVATGVIVEIEPVEQDSSLNAVVADKRGPGPPPVERDERDKVRICRDCIGVVLRNQEENLPRRTPTWVKLYEVLVQLQTEIEDSLPEFQELVLGVQKPSAVHTSTPPSATAALHLRKRLLTNLASYDTISKRIRDLPLTEGGGPGGAQDRLQRAIAARAALFLGDKLGVLRSLGDLDADGKNKDKGGGKKKKTVKMREDEEPTVQTLASLLKKTGGSSGRSSPVPGGGQVEQVAEASNKLAVLLEQEALVKGFVDEANARRQFEDAAALKASLDELREEIARIKAAT